MHDSKTMLENLIPDSLKSINVSKAIRTTITGIILTALTSNTYAFFVPFAERQQRNNPRDPAASNYQPFAPLPTLPPLATSTPLPTNTDSPTPTPIQSPTTTPTYSNSPTISATRTATPTYTRTFTQTFTPTASPTYSSTPTASPSLTNTRTATQTHTQTATRTNSPTPSYTRTITQTFTNSPTRTVTPTYTPSSTITETSTATPTSTPSSTPTVTPTSTPTPCGIPQPTAPSVLADLVGNNSIDYTWPAVPGATLYAVRLNGAFHGNSPTNSYTASGLNNTITYTAQVGVSLPCSSVYSLPSNGQLP